MSTCLRLAAPGGLGGKAAGWCGSARRARPARSPVGRKGTPCHLARGRWSWDAARVVRLNTNPHRSGAAAGSTLSTPTRCSSPQALPTGECSGAKHWAPCRRPGQRLRYERGHRGDGAVEVYGCWAATKMRRRLARGDRADLADAARRAHRGACQVQGHGWGAHWRSAQAVLEALPQHRPAREERTTLLLGSLGVAYPRMARRARRRASADGSKSAGTSRSCLSWRSCSAW